MMFLVLFFFFKQKTAYEMRISDWSSDVCSSDLDHADAIAAVDGVDVLFVGPADLRLALATEQISGKPDFEGATNRVVAAARRHGKRAGILVRDHRMIDKLQETGFSCFAVDSDIDTLRDGYRRVSFSKSITRKSYV